MTSLANNVVNNDNQKSAESFQEEWGNDLSENMIVLAISTISKISKN